MALTVLHSLPATAVVFCDFWCYAAASANWNQLNYSSIIDISQIRSSLRKRFATNLHITLEGLISIRVTFNKKTPLRHEQEKRQSKRRLGKGKKSFEVYPNKVPNKAMHRSGARLSDFQIRFLCSRYFVYPRFLALARSRPVILVVTLPDG